MKTFTGWEYLLIDLANSFGKDKLCFEDRIDWANSNLDNLEALLDEAETKPLYLKAVMAVRLAQQGVPTGHLVAMDATCSGVQIMSALTGCIKGANATGLVDPDRRADAYSDLNVEMNSLLLAQGIVVKVPRSDSKLALMTSCYGSTLIPKTIFGEDTDELEAFYKAVENIAPGAWGLLDELLHSWQPFALMHEWTLPDGFQAKIKVMEKKETRIRVEELGEASFTYQYYVNEGAERGRANVANVVHSVDGFVLRELIRRCSYNPSMVRSALRLLKERAKTLPITAKLAEGRSEAVRGVSYYMDHYSHSKQPTLAILQYITEESAVYVCKELADKLIEIMETMVSYRPFDVITIHDSFAAHANNVNHVRHWYKEILAELADSTVLDDILSQLHGRKVKYPKLSTGLSKAIRQSNYALS